MDEVINYWETEKKFYKTILSQDLFGEWVLERKWGSKFSKRGGEKTNYCSSYQEGLGKLRNISKIRKRHRYLIIQSP